MPITLPEKKFDSLIESARHQFLSLLRAHGANPTDTQEADLYETFEAEIREHFAPANESQARRSS